MRKFRRDHGGGKARLAVLVAALVITVLWAQSETKPRRGSPPGPRTSPGVAVAAPVPAVALAVDEATPEGWGADPFDPRSIGSTTATTGR